MKATTVIPQIRLKIAGISEQIVVYS